MALTPIGERVLIRTEKLGEMRTKSGIYLPKPSEEKKQGTIISVGSNKDGSPLPVKIGDKILFGGYSHEEIEIDGERLIIVELKDIIAKFS